MFALEHPFVTILLSAILGFVGKFLWDRWFAQGSRITKKECELMRTGCTAVREFNKREFLRLIEENKQSARERFEEEDEYCERRKEVRIQTLRMIRVIMMTQLQICNHLKLDCSEIGKALVDMGEVD